MAASSECTPPCSTTASWAKNCIIGAGALVPEGMVIPDGSVAVGVPARVIKQVSAAQIEANLHNAAHYVEHGKLHAAELAKG